VKTIGRKKSVGLKFSKNTDLSDLQHVRIGFLGE